MIGNNMPKVYILQPSEGSSPYPHSERNSWPWDNWRGDDRVTFWCRAEDVDEMSKEIERLRREIIKK
jgi:hypothetical protein